MRVSTIDHVMIAIPANSETAARQFYGELLGLPEVAKPESLQWRGGLWLQAGNLQLHLGAERDFRAARKAHVAFQVEDLDGLRATLKEAGLEITDDELLPGFDRFYVDDPFGNRLEFLEPANQ